MILKLVKDNKKVVGYFRMGLFNKMAIRVLMIDDDPEHLELSEQFLKRQSSEYEIATTENPEDALNHLFKGNFDAAICDFDLGEDQPTGLDLLEQVRGNKIDIPIIIFTGKSREEIAIQALNLGADYYIRKSSSDIEGLYAELSYYTLKSVQKRRTERALVESERKLRESETKLAEAQRIAHLGYWDWNIIEDNIRWSDETFRIFGLAPQEFEATYDSFLHSVHPDDRNFVRESVDKAIHENQKYSIDHRITLPNEKIRFVHEDAEITFDENGKAIRMMGTVQDITDRIQQEYLLKEERNKAERYLDLAGIMIMALDSKFKVTMINQKGCELLDSEEKDILGRNWIEAYIPENSRKIALQYLSSLVAGTNSGSCEMRIITSGGEEKKIFCQDRVLTDKDGKVTAILCSAREIEVDDATEQKNALEMLRKQKEELSDFAHSMSHDLKNIFHNMYGFIDLAEEEQNFAHVSRLRSLLNETVEMIEHSVALADAGLVIEETMNVNLSDLLEEVAKSIIPESVEYSQNGLPIVNADRSKVAQIFRNLFDNALHHGQPNIIEVVAVKTHSAYLIRIRNDGIAIPELQRSKIFERGYTTSKSGKGYGLAIVKRLAEAHGWKIRLLKERETTFEIEIPVYGHRE